MRDFIQINFHKDPNLFREIETPKDDYDSLRKEIKSLRKENSELEKSIMKIKKNKDKLEKSLDRLGYRKHHKHFKRNGSGKKKYTKEDRLDRIGVHRLHHIDMEQWVSEEDGAQKDRFGNAYKDFIETNISYHGINKKWDVYTDDRKYVGAYETIDEAHDVAVNL